MRDYHVVAEIPIGEPLAVFGGEVDAGDRCVEVKGPMYLYHGFLEFLVEIESETGHNSAVVQP